MYVDNDMLGENSNLNWTKIPEKFQVEWYWYGWCDCTRKILVKEFSLVILKEFKEKDAFLEYANTYDWSVKYSMKQMHFVNRWVILNNFLSKVFTLTILNYYYGGFTLTILNYCYGQHNNLEK